MCPAQPPNIDSDIILSKSKLPTVFSNWCESRLSSINDQKISQSASQSSQAQPDDNEHKKDENEVQEFRGSHCLQSYKDPAYEIQIWQRDNEINKQNEHYTSNFISYISVSP